MSYAPWYTNGMPGRDWDILSISLTDDVIPKIEQDTVAMLRYLVDHPDQLSDSWLFKAGGLTVITDEANEIADRFNKKMSTSGSFIIGTVGLYVQLVRTKVLCILAQAAGSTMKEIHKELLLAEYLQKADYPCAETPLEDEFLDALIELMPKSLDLSPAGLEAYKSYNGKSSGTTPTQFDFTSSTPAPTRNKPLIWISAAIIVIFGFWIDNLLISALGTIVGIVLLVLGLKKKVR